MSTTNDFVVRFANVNGSGSASANGFFSRALFRMGIPISAKNIFPSNIQGLPTWYEVRLSEKGHLARRDGVDLMVAMNAQTYEQDLQSVLPGGYLICDSTYPRKFEREDVTVLGIPIARMCAEAFEDPRQRQLFKNIAYVGTLAALLDIPLDVIETVIAEKLKKQQKLIEANVQALKMGYDYAVEDFTDPFPLKVRASEAAKNKIMITGNNAAGLGCIFGGATVAAWYPITPSTSLAEAFEAYVGRYRVDANGNRNAAVVQAEDEIAAIGVAIGAAWNGARAFTATSGPGISLMTEFIGLAYSAEIPVVLFDVQRGGPSTGMPTRTQQSDILACAYASHGDTRHVLLFPSDPRECFDMAAEAFDLAERLQTPVIVMSDLDIGMNNWLVDPLEWDDSKGHDRGKVLDAEALDNLTERFGRYKDVDGDAIPWRTLPGTHPDKGAYFTRGSSHDAYASYTEDGTVNAENFKRLTRKFDTAKSLVPAPELIVRNKDSRLGVIFFGSTEHAVAEALDQLEADGTPINALRLKSFPFNQDVAAFAAAHDRIFVVEMNRDAQMKMLLVTEAGIADEKLVPVLNFDGMPVTAEFIATYIGSVLKADEAVAQAIESSRHADGGMMK